MAAPSFISVTQTANSTATSHTTASIAVNNGDVLVATGYCENSILAETPMTIVTATGSTSAWTQQQLYGANNANIPHVITWTATATATGNITVTFSKKAAGTNNNTGAVSVWRNSNGIGNTNQNNDGTSTGAPTVSVTTTGANSALVFSDADWAGATGTVTFTASNGTPVSDVSDQTVSAAYCLYMSHVVDAGAIGSKTMGMSAPSAQRYGCTVVEVLGTASAVGWGFDPSLPTVLRRPPHLKAAPWNSISRVEEETPPPRWLNVGWEVQSVQPPNPATTNLSRSNRLAASSFARGDEGTEFPQVRWFNVGGEVQPFQPPNPATTNISRQNRRFAALVNGDDASGDESATTNWRNFGWEIQSVQPPNPITTNVSLNNRRAATLAQGDGGFYQPVTPQAQVVNWGFDAQPVQPPRFRLQRWASIVNGDDASGDETATVNWSNIGFEQQNVQPPKLRLQRWAAFVNGDDASGEDSPLVNWYNSGWEVQSVQPPRFRLQRWAAFVNGDDATSEENALVNWFNVGWEIQPPQPPHPRPERSGAVAPLSNVESVFVPPPVTTVRAFEAVLPTLKQMWGKRGEAAGGDIQFLSSDMQPWQEPQSVQPPHPRREKAGSIMPIESGIEAKFVFVPPAFTGWAADPVLPPLKGRSRTFSGAFANGDDATSEENPLINWPNAGWEIQSVQPPTYPKTRQRYVAIKGKSSFGILFNFYPWGSEVQPPQPPHPRPERSGALAKGDEGIENPYIFVGPTIVRWGFDGVYPQPPHPRPERSGSIQRGDDGTQNPYIFVGPTIIRWGFDAQPVQPPRLKWERRGSGLKNRIGFAVTAKWLNSGWEVQPPQPPHPRPERSGALARNGDEGIENNFIPPPPQIINWGFDPQSVQPPRSPKIRQRYTAIKGRSSFAVLPTFVTWQFDGVCPQPPHPRRERAQGIVGDSQFAFSNLLPAFPGLSAYEPMLKHPRPEKAGGIMPIEPGIEAAFVFVPLPPLPPIAFISSDMFKRPQRKAGAITPWSASYFMFVTSQKVFFARSTITAATGPTVVSRAKTQTIVKGEPA